MPEPAANTTPTASSSSGAPSPSGSAPSAAPPAASSPTPTPTRPDGLPEQFWDAQAGAKLPELVTELGRLAAFESAEAKRREGVPDKPEGYELKLPAEFKAPDTFKFDDKDARIEPLRAFAKETGLTNEQFGKLLAIHAQHEIADATFMLEAEKAEKQKLGSNSAARVEALKSGLKTVIGEKRMTDFIGGRPIIAADIEVVEDLLRAISTQGQHGFNGTGREQPAPPPQTIEDRWYPQRKAS